MSCTVHTVLPYNNIVLSIQIYYFKYWWIQVDLNIYFINFLVLKGLWFNFYSGLHLGRKLTIDVNEYKLFLGSWWWILWWGRTWRISRWWWRFDQQSSRSRHASWRFTYYYIYVCFAFVSIHVKVTYPYMLAFPSTVVLIPYGNSIHTC